MRVADADNKKSERKKTRNADGKKIIIIQTNKQSRKEIFLSSRCHIVGPFTYIHNVKPIVDTVILYPGILFTEIRTLRPSSLMHAYLVHFSFECLA